MELYFFWFCSFFFVFYLLGWLYFFLFVLFLGGARNSVYLIKIVFFLNLIIVCYIKMIRKMFPVVSWCYCMLSYRNNDKEWCLFGLLSQKCNGLCPRALMIKNLFLCHSWIRWFNSITEARRFYFLFVMTLIYTNQPWH